MHLEPEVIDHLNQRARRTGVSIGWALAFQALPNEAYVALTADTIDDDMESHHVVVFGPARVATTPQRNRSKICSTN